eukprot:1163278-Rhodomonas_salina.2
MRVPSTAAIECPNLAGISAPSSGVQSYHGVRVVYMRAPPLVSPAMYSFSAASDEMAGRVARETDGIFDIVPPPSRAGVEGSEDDSGSIAHTRSPPALPWPS